MPWTSMHRRLSAPSDADDAAIPPEALLTAAERSLCSELPEGAAARTLFPRLDPSVTYLNHGSYGACLGPVHRVQQFWDERLECEPVRFMADDVAPNLAHSITVTSRLLGSAVRPVDCTLVTNATTGVCTVLEAFRDVLKPGDSVLCLSVLYDAVEHALERLAERTGCSVWTLDVTAPFSAAAIVAAVTAALESDRGQSVKLCVIDHIASRTALVLPVAELCAVCDKHCVPVIVDGAHAVGQTAIAVDEWTGCVAYVTNLHKWLCAAKGVAVLWVAEAWQSRVHPLVTSHGWGGGFANEFGWQGTMNPSPLLSAAISVACFHELGMERVRKRNNALVEEGCKVLLEQWQTERLTPSDMTASMITIAVPMGNSSKGSNTGTAVTAADAQAVWQALWDRHRIEAMFFVVNNRLWVRISAQLYNSIEEYGKLADAIPAIVADVL